MVGNAAGGPGAARQRVECLKFDANTRDLVCGQQRPPRTPAGLDAAHAATSSRARAGESRERSRKRARIGERRAARRGGGEEEGGGCVHKVVLTHLHGCHSEECRSSSQRGHGRSMSDEAASIEGADAARV